jgi:hypothetical protein
MHHNMATQVKTPLPNSQLFDQPVDDLSFGAEDDFYEQGAPVEEGDEDVRAGMKIPTFWWANRRPDGDGGDRLHTGWHVGKGVWLGEFEDAMERAVADGRAEVVKIVHNDDEGSVVKEYYHLKTARVFPLSKGLPPEWKMNKHPEENVGIVFNWVTPRKAFNPDGTKRKDISTMKFQAIVVNLLKYGFGEPVVFTCARTWTIDMNNALLAHQRAVDAANDLLRKAGKTPSIRFRYLALDLLQADKYEWRPKTGTDRKECYAIVHGVPAKDIDESYIKARYCGAVLRQVIDEVLPTAVRWSIETGTLLKGGEVFNESDDAHPSADRGDGDPFGDDIGEPDITDENARATSEQRFTLAGYFNTLNGAGKKTETQEIRAALNDRELTANAALALMQKYSAQVYDLQKAGDKK